MPHIKLPKAIGDYAQLREFIDGQYRMVPNSVGTPMGANSCDSGRGQGDNTGTVDKPTGSEGTGSSGQGAGGATQPSNSGSGANTNDTHDVSEPGVCGGNPGDGKRTTDRNTNEPDRSGVAGDGQTDKSGAKPGNDGISANGQPGSLDRTRRKLPSGIKLENKSSDNPVSQEKAQAASERLQAKVAERLRQLQ